MYENEWPTLMGDSPESIRRELTVLVNGRLGLGQERKRALARGAVGDYVEALMRENDMAGKIISILVDVIKETNGKKTR